MNLYEVGKDTGVVDTGIQVTKMLIRPSYVGADLVTPQDRVEAGCGFT